MMIKVIAVQLLNDLIGEYKEYSHKYESFEEFILTTSDNNVYVWREVDNKKLKRVHRDN